ncbi:MAG: lipoate--protein ligase [Christensenellales bacterium]
MKNYIIQGYCHDPYANLAMEERLFERFGAHGAALYLWQNAHTVVIGKNQNAWSQCRLEALIAEGGKLARRTTGGGAVYHDLGNLNFSIILPKQDYDLMRQLGVVLAALAAFGLKGEFVGRNDLLLNGCKFSGSAFRFDRMRALHHGTLLVDVNMDRLSRYLTVDAGKLRDKGIESVRSRVCNLKHACPALNVESLRMELAQAFENEYGKAVMLEEEQLKDAQYLALCERNASSRWLYGDNPSFTHGIQKRFAWGQVELCLQVEAGCIENAVLYTDAMDVFEGLAEALVGCPYQSKAVAARLMPYSQELAAWVEEEIKV